MSPAAATASLGVPFAGSARAELDADLRVLACESTREFCVISDRAGFDGLEGEWTALFERAGRPEQLFQTFEWLSCWADHFLQDATRLRVVIGRCDGRLTMIWPLVETRGPFGLSTISWMGARVGQYGDALIEPGPHAQASLAEAWRIIRSLKIDAALLRKTRADSNVATMLAREAFVYGRELAPFTRFSRGADISPAPPPRSAKKRSRRRGLLRRLSETGAIAFSSADNNTFKQRLLLRAFAMKRAWLLRQGLYSQPIESDAMQAFFIDFAARFTRQIATLIDTIQRDGEAISVGVTLACKGAAFGHILAHDPDCCKQGVGVLLADHVMESCVARGLERFDMLAPYDAYKSEWAEDAAPVDDYVVGFTRRGRLFASIWSSGARQSLQALVKRMPARWGRIVWPLARKALRGRARLKQGRGPAPA